MRGTQVRDLRDILGTGKRMDCVVNTSWSFAVGKIRRVSDLR